jgi:polygalacturonase
VKYLTILILIIDQIGISFAGNPVFNVKDYGAVGDNNQLDTRSIQETINQCAKAGGGTVIFPSGTYLSGSLQLYDDITLYLDAGATLKGSSSLSDYNDMGRTSEERNTALIYAIGVSNIAISGRGTIDGNDSAYIDWDIIHPDCCFDASYTRQGTNFVNAFPDGPSEIKKSGRPGILIAFIECQNVLINNITVRNAPNWCVHLACCNRADIFGVDFMNSLLVPNADAIDISNSKNVNISNCIIVAGDDGIAISPCADGFCKSETENIHVSNCTITSRSAGIRIGWAEKNIRRCIFQNLVICSNRGIGIFAKQSEVIEDILFDNIIINTRLHTGWWGIGDPIHISEIPLGTWYGVEQNIQNHGIIRNIQFSDIQIVSENSIVLYGYNQYSIQNIDFSNLRHYFKNSENNITRGGNFELRPAFNNRYSVFKHDIPAFFAKNVKNLNISKYILNNDSNLPEFCTNAIYCEDFSGIKIDDFAGSSLNPFTENAVIHLENGDDVTIMNCRARQGTNIYLEQKNIGEHNSFMNNDLREAKIPVNKINK